jgi:hypothetical protein
MPWELGYFDGGKKQVAILPLVEREGADFKGQEYLTLYPILDKAHSSQSFGTSSRKMQIRTGAGASTFSKYAA